MSKFVDCLSETGFLPENIEIDEYVKSTPGLQEVYPVLCKVNTEANEELADMLASFLVIGYKIGLGTVNVEQVLNDECNMYKERFEEIFALIEAKDLTAANELTEELLVDLGETPVGLSYELIEELQDKLDELNEGKSSEVTNDEESLEDSDPCNDPNCGCNSEETSTINVDTPISILFSNGEPFTFTAQDVINYVEGTKEEVNQTYTGFPIDVIDLRWK